MARLSHLGYRSAGELLAEKFHTGEELITLLNPGKTVDRAGTVITVPNVADGRPAGQVLRIEVDKPAKAVRAFGRNDEMVATSALKIAALDDRFHESCQNGGD
jgi:hypothetical protein